MTISNMPLKGMNDWFFEEFELRHYLFSVWREVCQSFSYHEYLTPILENADLYRAKSGEDVGGKELMVLVDRGGRELAIRPEMTPSVTRLISRIYGKEPKPIRFFSIANFVRNERPQRGRNREFWQLNLDIFGEESILADCEIIQICLEILFRFNPPKDSFTCLINHRKLIDSFFNLVLEIAEDNRLPLLHLMDKYKKLPVEIFLDELEKMQFKEEAVKSIKTFMQLDSLDTLCEEFPILQNDKSIADLQNLFMHFRNIGYEQYLRFSPSVLRGFDYYDGIVFEVFDNHPQNNRSMFGGGRYNALAGIFGGQSFPSVGCAPGDETLYLFLESWGLLDVIKNKIERKQIYIPILEEKLIKETTMIGNKIRKQNIAVSMGLSVEHIRKALQAADKSKASFIVLYGSKEHENSIVTIKNMKTGDQAPVPLNLLDSYFL